MNIPETINIEKYAEALNNLVGMDIGYLGDGDENVNAIVEVIRAAKALEYRVKELEGSLKMSEHLLKGAHERIEQLDELCGDLQNFKRDIFDEAYDYNTIADWYISSVDDKEPIWTDAHLEELLNDFYVIPKEIVDEYKM